MRFHIAVICSLNDKIVYFSTSSGCKSHENDESQYSQGRKGKLLGRNGLPAINSRFERPR